MSERSKFANEPLMYIHQPTQGKPSAPMQYSYKTPKKSTINSTPTPQMEKKTIPAPVKKRPTLNSFQNAVAENPQEKEKRPSIQNEEKTEEEGKKKFKDMTIEEKVHYFMNTPSHLPRMRCEVLTEERKYRGIIIDFEDGEIRMRVGRRNVFLKMEDIKEIQLLGLGL